MNEAQFATAVEDLLEVKHWLWCHYRPARRKDGSWYTPLSGHKGLMDYIATKDGRLLLFELKSDKGKMSDDQLIWKCELSMTSAEIYVWKPADWPFIQETLTK